MVALVNIYSQQLLATYLGRFLFLAPALLICDAVNKRRFLFYILAIVSCHQDVPVVIVRNKMDTLVAEGDLGEQRSVDLERQVIGVLHLTTALKNLYYWPRLVS